MIIAKTPAEMRAIVAANESRSRGLVPTMGALHAGHETLLQRCRTENELSILSIFVNPIQFNVVTDFDKYPRNIERDLSIAEHHGTDVVYMPNTDDMYPEGFRSHIEPPSVADPLEGEMRPGHFRGVTTVVAKLFNATSAHRAYFGKKDFQQLAVVRRLVEELDFPVEIVGVETVREEDGLAMSSRNVRLDAASRLDAPIIHRALRAVATLHRAGEARVEALENEFLKVAGQSRSMRLEYASVRDASTLAEIDMIVRPAVMCVAVWYGEVRLIDNIELGPGSSAMQ